MKQFIFITDAQWHGRGSLFMEKEMVLYLQKANYNVPIYKIVSLGANECVIDMYHRTYAPVIYIPSNIQGRKLAGIVRSITPVSKSPPFTRVLIKPCWEIISYVDTRKASLNDIIALRVPFLIKSYDILLRDGMLYLDPKGYRYKAEKIRNGSAVQLFMKNIIKVYFGDKYVPIDYVILTTEYQIIPLTQYEELILQ